MIDSQPKTKKDPRLGKVGCPNGVKIVRISDIERKVPQDHIKAQD